MSRRPQQTRFDSPPAEDLRQIIQGDPVASARLTVQWGETIGRALAKNGVSVSQIRGVFGQARRIEMNWPIGANDSLYAQQSLRDLMLLKPKMQYQAQREGKIKPLVEVLSEAIDYVADDREGFQRFIDLFEAILAYHKAEGGK